MRISDWSSDVCSSDLTGEIKRVVTSLLMHVDELPSYAVVIAATNHSELLDRAVWRRFQLRLGLPGPGEKELTEFFDRFLASFDKHPGVTAPYIAKRLGAIRYAEPERVEEHTSALQSLMRISSAV